MSITGLASDAQLRQVQRDLAKAEQQPAEAREYETRRAGVTLESAPVPESVNGGVRGIDLAGGRTPT